MYSGRFPEDFSVPVSVPSSIADLAGSASFNELLGRRSASSNSALLESSSHDNYLEDSRPLSGAKGSKFIGVRQRKNGKWVAEIRDRFQKTRHWLGTFNTEEEAARAYDAEAKRIRGRKTRLNFPEELTEINAYVGSMQENHPQVVTEETEPYGQSIPQKSAELERPETGHGSINQLQHNHDFTSVQNNQFQNRISEQDVPLSPLSISPTLLIIPENHLDSRNVAPIPVESDSFSHFEAPAATLPHMADIGGYTEEAYDGIHTIGIWNFDDLGPWQ